MAIGIIALLDKMIKNKSRQNTPTLFAELEAQNMQRENLLYSDFYS